MLHRLKKGVLVAIWGGVAVGACGGSEAVRKDDPLGLGDRKTFTAPPKPGHSLSGSVKCTCHACDPAHCCDDGDGSLGNDACDAGYDFSECGISVESCASRCFQKVWRVPKAEACDSRRPTECCQGG
jgi:hypothetical protein